MQPAFGYGKVALAGVRAGPIRKQGTIMGEMSECFLSICVSALSESHKSSRKDHWGYYWFILWDAMLNVRWTSRRARPKIRKGSPLTRVPVWPKVFSFDFLVPSTIRTLLLIHSNGTTRSSTKKLHFLPDMWPYVILYSLDSLEYVYM